jgi:hypothetical protein
MGDISISREMSAAEIARRSDEAWRRAFADMKANRNASFGIGIAKTITAHYAKKRLCAVAFVKLEDHPERGTMRGSTDGSIRRSFRFRTEGTAIEDQSSDPLILMAMPRKTRLWINREFSACRLGWAGSPDLVDGDWTDEQRAEWQVLCETASRIEDILARGRQPAPRRRTYTGTNPW